MPEARIDWRLEVYNDVRPHALPPAATEAVVKIVASLGLRYAAVDLKLAGSGRYYFLEANPWGQFLFVEVLTGLPISGALAGALAR
jgi:glutathione synthase/RimK-type ligase-like ATP-grasp enzyme